MYPCVVEERHDDAGENFPPPFEMREASLVFLQSSCNRARDRLWRASWTAFLVQKQTRRADREALS